MVDKEVTITESALKAIRNAGNFQRKFNSFALALMTAAVMWGAKTLENLDVRMSVMERVLGVVDENRSRLNAQGLSINSIDIRLNRLEAIREEQIRLKTHQKSKN